MKVKMEERGQEIQEPCSKLQGTRMVAQASRLRLWDGKRAKQARRLRHHCLRGFFAAVLALFFQFISPSYALELDPAELYLKAEAEFKNLWAMECSYSWTAETHIPGTRPRLYERKTFLRYNRPCFWAREYMIAGNTTNINYAAFDGRQYQLLWSDYMSCMFSRERTFIEKLHLNFESPTVFTPYFFVCTPDFFADFSAFTRAETWAEVAKRTTIVGEGQVNGTPTVETEITEPRRKDMKIHYYVSFARDLGFYPIAWTIRREGHSVTKGAVREWREVSCGDSKIRVPGKIELVFQADGREASTTDICLLDIKTFRCGQRLPMEQFTLAVPRAYPVYDSDRNLVLKEADIYPPAHPRILPLQ